MSLAVRHASSPDSFRPNSAGSDVRTLRVVFVGVVMVLVGCGDSTPTAVTVGPLLTITVNASSANISVPVPFTVTNHAGKAVHIPVKCTDSTQMLASPAHWNGNQWVKEVTNCIGAPLFVTLQNGESAQSTVTFDVAAPSLIEIDAQSVDGSRHFPASSNELQVK